MPRLHDPQAVKMEIGDPRMNKRYGPAQLGEQLESMKVPGCLPSLWGKQSTLMHMFLTNSES